MTAAPVFGAEGGHGGGGINPLSPQEVKGDLALWTVVVFVLLLLLLWKFAWGPIAAGLDKRERDIAEEIAQAEAANQKAAEVLADYEAKLAAAAEQVRAIVEQGRRDAEKLGAEMLDRAKAEAEAEHARAMQQIEAATAAALEELGRRSAALAVDLAGKIVRAKLSAADHSRLIEQAVAGFAKGSG